MPGTVQLKPPHRQASGLSNDQSQLSVGILQLGSPVHGVQRYGRIIAAELRRFPGVSVVERHHDLTRAGWAGVANAARVPRSFSGADVVVVPYCKNALWGSQRARLAQLATVLSGIRAPVVMVLHDVYSAGGRRRAEWWAMAMCTALPQALVIHGEHERPRLYRMPRAGRARVIPHFIERREPISREKARRELGVEDATRIVGVLGWIHPRKQYETAIRLLATLDPSYRLWLIGAVPQQSQAYMTKLTSLARELGVTDRMTVTGYIEEDELALRMAALDVGLCPYRDASASGSMSTLLSARRPIVANHFELAAELTGLAPEAITLVSDNDLGAYRAAIVDAVRRSPAPSAFDALLDQHDPHEIATQYLETLRTAAAGTAGHRPALIRR